MISISLKRYCDTDKEEIINNMLSSKSLFDWLPQHSFQSQDEVISYFDNRLKGYYHEFFTIKNYKNNMVGIVYSHDYYPNDRHTMMSVIIFDNYRMLGYGALASIIFCNYLFSYYSLNKIFTSVYSYNKLSMSLQKTAALNFEGKLTAYRYYNNQFYDLYYYSILKDNFYLKHKKFLEKTDIKKLCYGI